jgi:ubiquinone/menaquinone biosynthesis C-methylase UbiE
MDKQVDKSHYKFEKYCDIDRWSSYFYQIREISDLKIKSVLEIGVGDGLLGNYIKNNTDIEYKSIDSDKELRPDIIGTVEKIPFADNNFDVVCIFEVLEHLPFGKFEKILKELKRVSRRYVIISLPHFGPTIKFLLKIPFFREFAFSFKIPFYKKHIFNGEHYWEIGKKNYEPEKIIKILKNHFTVKKNFVPFENQYHHFYVLEK